MSDHYTQLFAAVEACRPRRILEIGTWDGAHGAEMIRIAQRFHRDVEYYGFDLWAPANAEELSKPVASMKDAGSRLRATGAYVALVPGNTRETMPACRFGLPLMDFIFIDGGHSLETIASDWRHCAGLMHSDTAVVLDDYYPDRTDAGAKQLVDALTADPAYRVEIGPVTEYPNLRVCMAFVRMAC